MSETAGLQDEFDTVPLWTAQAVEEIGSDAKLPAGCRGSGSPEALRWLARAMGLRAGTRLLDSGAGVGGPSEVAAREFGVAPVLVDPMPGACAAAARIFGLPVAVAAGEQLPFATATFDAAWSLGVLCTIEDKEPVLAELRRVVTAGGPVGLLVFVRTRETLADQPEGNHFPSLTELTSLLERAGLVATDHAALADFPQPPADWQDLADRVDAVIERDHGADERFGSVQDQQASIGRLLAEGLVVGQLLVARAALSGTRAG